MERSESISRKRIQRVAQDLRDTAFYNIEQWSNFLRDKEGWRGPQNANFWMTYFVNVS